MISKNIKRGQVFMANLGSNKGSVQGGIRPVVVISNPLNNKFSPTINVLPITSKTKTNIPVHVGIGIESGLPEESTILTEQFSTIDKVQLLELLGMCPQYKMVEIAKAIVLQTSLEGYLNVV